MIDRAHIISSVIEYKIAMLESMGQNSLFVTLDVLKEILALLKEQEPKLVHVTADINRRKIGECPNCGKMINSGDYPNYCGRCGQAVKWE